MVVGVGTTLELNDELVRRAKHEAARAGVPLRRWVEDALRARLLPPAREHERFCLEVPVCSGALSFAFVPVTGVTGHQLNRDAGG